MKICAISDTHMRHQEFDIPECDVIIHAGDSTFFGNPSEIGRFIKWFEKQSAKHKVMIAGNHELGLDTGSPKFNKKSRDIVLNSSITYLEDSSTTINGIKIYGTPWTPKFFDWAFNGTPSGDLPTPSQPLLKDIYGNIPTDTDILVCHGPPYGIIDRNRKGNSDERLGSAEMRYRIQELKKLKLYISGHIHEAYGREYRDGVQYCNVASLQRDYCTHNPVTVIHLDESTGFVDVEDNQ